MSDFTDPVFELLTYTPDAISTESNHFVIILYKITRFVILSNEEETSRGGGDG